MKKGIFRKFLSLCTAGALTAGLVVTASAAPDTMTRGEMAALLVESAGLSGQLAEYQAKPSAFSDVAENSIYEGAINLVYAKGLMSCTSGDTFSPNAAATQVEAAAILLRYADVPNGVLTAWPASYNTAVSSTGLTQGVEYSPNSAVNKTVFVQMMSNAKAMEGKPFIGISWKSNTQDYAAFATVIRAAGGVAVELPQITSSAVEYDSSNKVTSAYLEESGMLKQAYADQIKAKNFANTNVAQVMAEVDGVFFTGGEDINPDLYGDEHSPLLEDNTEYRDIRDTSDYNLIQAAVQTDEPMLAICRGMQMLNVVCGGGLIQDLPTYLGKDDSYRVHRNKPDWARHDITVTDTDSLLYSIVGGTSLADVASWHHQVANPRRVGQGLTVVAYGPDEVIEALEYQANDFTLGVQFHPEADALDHDAYMDFFEALLAHAS